MILQWAIGEKIAHFLCQGLKLFLFHARTE